MNTLRPEDHPDAWPHQARPGPLAGVRVLDLSRVLAGPLCTCVLGDLGADVVKVERPGSGDDTRHWGPPWHGDDAAYFFAVNRNRRSIALDMRDAQGREAVRRLARSADVVVENFLPMQATTLGIDRLAEECTHAVWCSIRAAGSDGPDGNEPGYDVMAQARSGMMSITGDAASGPMKIGVAVCDIVCGLYAATAIAAALYERAASGSGQRIEVPLLESSVAALAHHASNLLVGGLEAGLIGNRHPNVAPYGTFRCRDGRIVAGATTEGQFAKLCTAIGGAALLDDPRFTTNRDRIANREALDAAVESLLMQRTAAEWMPLLRAAGVACSPVNSIGDVFADPHIRAVEMVQTVDHPAGPLPLVRSPLRFSRTPASIHLPPPLLGEHTEAILAALGMAGAQPDGREQPAARVSESR